jgi:starch synthase
MYSLKYGTIPIVHATGGLADTIQNYDPKAHNGNGFSFHEYTADAMIESIREAIQTFRNKAQWKFLRDNAMKCDYSWKVSAEQYKDLDQSMFSSNE